MIRGPLTTLNKLLETVDDEDTIALLIATACINGAIELEDTPALCRKYGIVDITEYWRL